MPGDRAQPQAIVKIIFIALALVLYVSSAASAMASSTVHGNVYQWSSFDVLKSAEVVVNSVPMQKMVSVDGSYAFNLTKGSYTIIAVSGANTTDALYARENITITQDGGDYVIDLILFPPTDLDDLSLLDENYTAIPPDEPIDAGDSSLMILALAGGAILAVAAIAIVFLLVRRNKSKGGSMAPPASETPSAILEPETPPSEPAKPSLSDSYTLPDDLKEVIRIMEKNGGRMTQLDLRKALPYSEAKVSLMISDLESRGIVKKIKKGRGNILILNTNGDEQ